MSVSDILLGVNACEFDLPDRTLTNSAMEKVFECPGAYNFAYNLMIKSAGFKAAIVLGSAAHEAVEQVKQLKPLEEALAIGEQVFDKELAKIVEEADDEEIEFATDKATTARAQMRAMVRFYVDQAHGEPGAPDKDIDFHIMPDGSASTERVLGPVALINPDTGEVHDTFGLAGKNDGNGVRRSWRDDRMTFELKTTSESPSQVMSAMRVGSQVPLYQWIGMQIDRIEPSSTMVDIVAKPTIRLLKANQRRKVAETPEEYEQRCYDAFYKKQMDAVFLRQEIAFSEENIRTALANMWQAAELIKYFDANGYPCPRGRRCRKSFGWCDYKSLCWYNDDSKYYYSDVSHEELGIAS